jgi:diguanylate cyclase (GGDEF)-like protein
MEQEINILIIEEDKEHALFLEKVLKGVGYKTWIAYSGKEGISLTKSRNFATVVTELHLPDMDAKKLTQEILKINSNISVVIITTYTFIKSAIECMEEGAYGYITKPFNPSEVRIVVERAAERFLLLSSGREKERFVELSVKDGLTGVYNRRFLNVYMTNKISIMKRKAEKLSILMIDIDHFKQYNDTKGHMAGDELLKKMCKLFQESIRAEDIVFRYGGEEFVILLEYTDKRGASLVAERIRSLVNLYMPTTVSIGVGTFPDDGVTLEELIAKTDAALYKAKETGRDKVCVVE